MLVGVAFLRTGELSHTESWRFQHGGADAVLPRDTEVTPGLLPEGSHSVDYLATSRVVGTAGGDLCRCGLSDMPFESLTDGIVTITAGRPPERSDEVLLSEAAASALGTGLGERVELTRPFELDATVVGLGYRSLQRDSPIVVTDPEAGLLDDDDLYASQLQLVDLPDDMSPDELLAWEEQAGPHLVSPAYPMPMMTTLSGDNANVRVRWTWAGGAAGLTVLGIVIAAAFAASARRQVVTLGQLAANGATPALLRRVLFLQGTATGLLGSVTGLALGAVVLAASRPWADQLLGSARPGWDLRWLDVLPIVVIALVAATLAALIPAFDASRVSVLTALSGRRPLGQVPRRRTALGLASIAAGTGLVGFASAMDSSGRTGGTQAFATACAVAGPVFLLLGVCTATPAYVTVLRPVARVVRGHWRLAARSLFRQRTRTSAMVSAICAISAVAVAAAAFGLAMERDERSSRALTDMPNDVVRVQSSTFVGDGFEVLPPPEVLESAARQAQATLPDTERYDIAHAVDPVRRAKPAVWARDFVPADPGEPGDGEVSHSPQQATIVDEEYRRAYDIDAATQHLLDEIGAVHFGPSAGRVTIETIPLAGTLPPSTFAAGVLEPEHAHGYGSASVLLLTPQRAEELGLVAALGEIVLRTPEPLTATQRDAIDRLSLRFEAEAEDAAIAAGAPSPSAEPEPSVWVDFERPQRHIPPDLIETVPATVALLFALFVVAAGLALAAAETRDERDVLAVLGAPPPTLRRTSGDKAFLLTLLGAVAAVPVGLVPVAVVTGVAADGLPVVVPWRTIALLVVAIPLLAAALTSTAARVASRYHPVHVSTATFD
jgi:putative ABC transport system permease protein